MILFRNFKPRTVVRAGRILRIICLSAFCCAGIPAGAFSPAGSADPHVPSGGRIRLVLENAENPAAGEPVRPVQLEAEVAADGPSRAAGLMHRRELPAGQGMIFLFPRDERLSFWMKDTPLPLSVALLDAKGEIREICDMEPFDLTPVRSGGFRRFALEVPQGWFRAQGIAPGWRLSAASLETLRGIHASD